MIKIENISFKYSDKTIALRNVNIEIAKGHIFAILGESGSGKTTLLKCIGKFLKPQSGKILLNGKNIQDINEIKFRKSIGIVFQQLFLFPHLTVLENMILAPVKVLKKNKNTASKEAKNMLGKLGIGEIQNNYPSRISGGQAQRVAIARALLLKPEYLLLDEPTSALDVNTSEEFGKWLLYLKEFTTFVIVTHDVLFAGKITSSGVMIENGKVQTTGNVKKLMRKYTTQE